MVFTSRIGKSFLRGVAGIVASVRARSLLNAARREVRRYQESGRRLDVAQRAAGVGYWEVELLRGEVFWSAAFCEALGIPESTEPSNENFFTFVHPEDWREIEIALDVARVTGDFRTEFRLHPRFGERWFQSVGKLTENKDGIPVEMTGVVMDISKVKGIQRDLRDSERRFRSLADALPQLVWSGGRDGTAEYCNDRWLEYTGTAIPREGAASWLLAVDEGDRARVEELWQCALQEGKGFSTECRLTRVDGEPRWFTVHVVPMRDHSDLVVRWFGSCTDIHDQRLLLQERERLLESERAARSEAERANSSKDQFVAVLSHELRSPLNAILGWSQMIRRGKLSDERLVHAIEVIEKNTKLQAQLISDLLDINRIVCGKMRLESTLFDLREVCATTVKSIVPTATAKHVRVLTDLRECGEYRGDPLRMQQVLWNLLSNAVKFTPEGGDVLITCERIGGDIRIVVSDTGEGIPPDVIGTVFERYSQADLSSVRKHGGLGLGLSIVKHIVDGHGGRVEAASAGKGKGATFSVLLPERVAPDSVLVGEGSEPQQEGEERGTVVQLPLDGCLEGLRLLVVDDQSDSRDLVRSILHDDGGEVVAVGSVAEALACIDSVQPDLVISDIGMPGRDGYSFIKQLRESGGRFAQIPAIALTAFARSEDRQQALDSGFSVHLTKPVDAKRLVSAILSLVPHEQVGNL